MIVLCCSLVSRKSYNFTMDCLKLVFLLSLILVVRGQETEQISENEARKLAAQEESNMRDERDGRDMRDERNLKGPPGGENREESDHLQHYNRPVAKEFFHNLMRDVTFHEFRATVNIPRGTIDCYEEDCEKNSELMASFQSETPGSIKSKNLLRASIRFPNGSLATWLKAPAIEGRLQLYCPYEGLYQFCIENTVDSLTAKKVEMHLMVLHHAEVVDFHRAHQEDNDTDTFYKLYDKMYQVFHDIAMVKLAVRHEKNLARRDWELLRSNNDLVLEVSIFMIIVITIVTYGQVYYLKRLFVVDARHRNGSTVKL